MCVCFNMCAIHNGSETAGESFSLTRLDKTSHHDEIVFVCNRQSDIRRTDRVKGETPLSSSLHHVFPSFHLIILVCKSDSPLFFRFPVSLFLSHTLSILPCMLARPLPLSWSIHLSICLPVELCHPLISSNETKG